jgi:hypothetical protein
VNAVRFLDPYADRPSIAVGPGGNQARSQVVVSWSDNPYPNTGTYAVNVSAAPINNLGDTMNFGRIAAAPTYSIYDYNVNQSVAVGPDGTIMVCWQTVPQGGSLGGPSAVYTATSPALIPLGFNPGVPVAALNIGTSTSLGVPGPLYNNSRGVQAVAELAWDRSGGQYNGRAYIVFTDSPYLGTVTTNIFSRVSTDNGASWPAPSNPINDDAGYSNGLSHFLPQMAIDPTSGYLAAAWYDARNSGDNTKVQTFASVSRNGGQTWAANQQITGTLTTFAIPYAANSETSSNS